MQRHHLHLAQVRLIPSTTESTTDLRRKVSQLPQRASPHLTSSQLQARLNKLRISHKSLSNLKIAQASDWQIQGQVHRHLKEPSFSRNVPVCAQPPNQLSHTQMIPVHQTDPSLSRLATQAHQTQSYHVPVKGLNSGSNTSKDIGNIKPENDLPAGSGQDTDVSKKSISSASKQGANVLISGNKCIKISKASVNFCHAAKEACTMKKACIDSSIKTMHTASKKQCNQEVGSSTQSSAWLGKESCSYGAIHGLKEAQASKNSSMQNKDCHSF